MARSIVPIVDLRMRFALAEADGLATLNDSMVMLLDIDRLIGRESGTVLLAA